MADTDAQAREPNGQGDYRGLAARNNQAQRGDSISISPFTKREKWLPFNSS